MSLETVQLEHIPETYKVHIALFKDVKNSSFLQSQLVARNPDFEYALIDATAAISRLHILAATFRAIVGQLGSNLKTPNIHSEIVLSMSPSNNIAEAYKKFGITAATKHVAIVKVVFPTESRPTPPSAEDVWKHLAEHVEGIPMSVTDVNIAADTDWAKVHKMYKINGPILARVDAMDEGEKIREKEMIALGGIALRGT